MTSRQNMGLYPLNKVLDKIKQNDSHTEMSVKYRTEKIVIKSKIFMTPQVCKGQLNSE